MVNAANPPAGRPLIRPFRRDDRDQLTALVNAHIQSVIPGPALSVNAVLSALERETGEFIVDPWVVQRVTLVAEQRGRIVAAAHLLRYGDDDAVGAAYRGMGEIRWLLCWPDAPFWRDAISAGHVLASAAVASLSAAGVVSINAGGGLPAPGIYGVPDQWPHVAGILERAGFVAADQGEIVLLADIAAIPRPPLPVVGTEIRRTLGSNGTRFTGELPDGDVIGYIEVDQLLGDAGRVAVHGGWADVGNLHVSDRWRGHGVRSWLLGVAADWLELAKVDRLLDYSAPDDGDLLDVLTRAGFTPLTRMRRDWVLRQ